MSDDFLDDLMSKVFGKDGFVDRVFSDAKKPLHEIEKRLRTSERHYYQEALVTELLITLAGKGLLSNDEAKAVIAHAKERASKKAKASSADTEDDPRPHKSLYCDRCHGTTPHLIEGPKARCRACVTERSA